VPAQLVGRLHLQEDVHEDLEAHEVNVLKQFLVTLADISAKIGTRSGGSPTIVSSLVRLRTFFFFYVCKQTLASTTVSSCKFRSHGISSRYLLCS
jgi:hypothetical protein